MGRERPILFSGDMVRAILDGRKSVTRRVVKPQPAAGVRKSVFVPSGLEDGHGKEIRPRYFPGDRLWVRETWAPRGEYKATPWAGATGKAKWTPSIHMPRWASRITLEVTGVRVERVQDITEDGAKAEGFSADPRCKVGFNFPRPHQARDAFAGTWIDLYGEESWNKNPWVWVVEFKKLEGQTPSLLEENRK